MRCALVCNGFPRSPCKFIHPPYLSVHSSTTIVHGDFGEEPTGLLLITTLTTGNVKVGTREKGIQQKRQAS